MKRILSVLMILVMVVGLLAACATVPGENGAEVGEYVSGSSQDVDPGEGPQKVENMKGDDTSGGDSSGGDDSTGGDTIGGDTSGGDETPGGDTSTGDDTTDDDEEEEGGIPENALVFGTFNIKRFFDGTTAEDVCAEVIQSDCDIIGFQEVSNGQIEIGGIDQTKFMADKCGYKYYYFCPAGSEQYGTCILSRYEIKKYEHVSFSMQAGEHRKYGRYIIDVNGTEIIWYNTHLATQGQDSVTGPAQFQEMFKRAANDAAKGPVVVTGDFNLFLSDQKNLVNRNVFLALNGGESMDFLVDYPRGNTTLDNIYVSKQHFEPAYENSNMGHVKYISSDASDHDIIWGYVVLK